jgi:hypothetical protein
MRGEGKSMELLPHKSIITQVEKTQFDYAASVSAYSDIVSETVSADHLFRFVFSENKIKLKKKNYFAKIIKKNGSGTVTLFQLLLQLLFQLLLQLLFQHHMFILNCFLFANGAFRHHCTSKKKTLLIIPTFLILAVARSAEESILIPKKKKWKK